MTEQELSFEYEMASMALKAKRFKEAEEKFMAIGSKTNSWEAWCGLGISKYGLIMENIPIEEVFYCFKKAKSIEQDKTSEIEISVIQTSIDVIKSLYDLVELSQHSIEQGKSQMVRSAITGVIGAAMTMRNERQGKVMGTIVSAGITAISFDSYANARSTVAELQVLNAKVLALINQIKKQTLEFATVEIELANKFNTILIEAHKQVTVVTPQLFESAKRKKKSKFYNDVGMFFYLGTFGPIVGIIMSVSSNDPDKPPLFLFVFIGCMFYLIGNHLKKKSKELNY